MRSLVTISVFLFAISFSQSHIVSLWNNGVPGAIANPSYVEDTVYTETGAPRIRNVSNPMLYIYLPPKEKSNGTAVVICPGGGYMRLAMDIEGDAVAKWLNENGIAAIVLKYRLPSDLIMKEKKIGPLQDAQEAIRSVRRKSHDWNIDPNKIGVMGFSAGGHLAASVSTLFDEKVYEVKANISARPNFSILVYPVISMEESITHTGSRKYLLGEFPDSHAVRNFSTELHVNINTPPAFLVHAADDKSVPVENSIRYATALNKNSIPTELHVYENGGHGFGLAVGKGTASSWPDASLRWLEQHRYLTK